MWQGTAVCEVRRIADGERDPLSLRQLPLQGGAENPDVQGVGSLSSCEQALRHATGKQSWSLPTVFARPCLFLAVAMWFWMHAPCPGGLTAGGEDVGVVAESVEQGGVQFLVAEDLDPIGEREVGGDDRRAPLVAVG